MRRFPLYHVDAFAVAPFTGNPAAVVLEDPARGLELSDEERQQVASELNLSETAFVAPAGAANRFSLRWFSPRTEIPLCGHATLATALALRENGAADPSSPLVFQTRMSGELGVRAGAGEGAFAMAFPANVPVALGADRDASAGALPPPGLVERLVAAALPEALRARVADVAFEPAMRKLLLRLHASPEEIGAMPCPAAALAGVDQQEAPEGASVRGVSVFALRDPTDGAEGDGAGAPWAGCSLVSRYFAPWVGIDEDPVNGSSHTALAPLAAALDAAAATAHGTDPAGQPLLWRGDAYMMSPRGGRLQLTVTGEPQASGERERGTGSLAAALDRVRAAATGVSIGGPAVLVHAGTLMLRGRR